MKIKEFGKSHRMIYAAYYYCMSGFVNFIKLFVKTDENMVLFVSYGGKHYNDSPQVIFEKMLEDERFSKCRFVWAFVKPENFDIFPGAKKVKIDTLAYYITALRARVWITNVIVERALNFTGNNTFYLCTAHGITLKKGSRKEGVFDTLAGYHYDCLLAQSEFEKKCQIEHFGISGDKIAVIGYPRNDLLVNCHEDIRNRVCKALGINGEKKMILYAPTYRDWEGGEGIIPIDIEKWREKLGNNYVLLFRAHPTVKISASARDSFFINVSSYESIAELMLASDMLISDYSSVFFDYSLLKKPMICWAYDYEKYTSFRKLRINVLEELYGGKITEDELIEMILDLPSGVIMEMVTAFQKKYVSEYGNAAEKALEIIYENMRS